MNPNRKARVAPSAPPMALAVPFYKPSAKDTDGPPIAADAVAIPIVRPNPIEYWDPYNKITRTRTSKKLKYRADGKKGADGRNGANGHDGSGSGSSGYPGQSAAAAMPGENGGVLELRLSHAGEVSFARQRPCRLRVVKSPSSSWIHGSSFQGQRAHAHAGESQEEEILELGDFPDICISSIGGNGGNGGRGGNGGNGARGRSGRNATRYSNGSSGGTGGNGGDGGHGSNGGHGGQGGLIHISIPERDRFLLMAIQGATYPSPLVKGGKGGQKGSHGEGGAGGPGGWGGSSYSYTDSDGNRQHNPGGFHGHSGVDGQTPNVALNNGDDGLHGKFTVELLADNGHNSGFSAQPKLHQRRYDLELVTKKLDPTNAMAESNCFQFGDTVYVRQITVQNRGGMTSPSEKVVFSLLDPSDSIMPVTDKKAMMPYDYAAISEGQSREAEGSLAYVIPLPEGSFTDRDDFDPLVVAKRLRLRATQLGPQENGSDSCFRRDYESFDQNGTNISFCHPIQNTDGFRGISSLRAGETMKVGFKLNNVSLQDIGSQTKDSRKVWVQFYSEAEVDLYIDGEQCANLDKKPNEDQENAPWRGHVIDVPRIESESSVKMVGTLRLSNQIPPYERVAVKADILLENLASPLDDDGSGDQKSISLIQRRKLEVVCEPTCAFQQDCDVVLVTSESTSRAQFISCKELIEKRLGLKMDVYSVSLYGSLSPDFFATPDKSIREYFAGKLVIVLDETFNPLDDSVDEMSPSDMLPNGCMEQASGFSSSTKWLFVGSSQSSIQGLLMSHYTAAPDDVTTFTSKSEFQRTTKERLKEERLTGNQEKSIIEQVIGKDDEERHPTADQTLKNRWKYEKAANKMAVWLRANDPLRQHVVEWYSTSAKLVVRRGFCSTMNSAFVVNANNNSSETIQFAVARALPPEISIKAFCHSLKAEDREMCLSFRNAFNSNFLTETENFILGEFSKSMFSDDIMIQKFFPSISSMMDNKSLAGFIEENHNKHFVQDELSSLVGQLRSVANSKDLRPWWKPFSSKYRLNKNLMERVGIIEERWGQCIDQDIIQAHTEQIKESVRTHIKKTRKKQRIRVHNRWRKGLRWRFSLNGESNITFGVYPLVEMGRFYKFQRNSERKFTHRQPLTRTLNGSESEGFRGNAQRRMVVSKKLLQSIQATRQQEVLSIVEPEIDLTS